MKNLFSMFGTIWFGKRELSNEVRKLASGWLMSGGFEKSIHGVWFGNDDSTKVQFTFLSTGFENTSEPGEWRGGVGIELWWFIYCVELKVFFS